MKHPYMAGATSIINQRFLRERHGVMTQVDALRLLDELRDFFPEGTVIHDAYEGCEMSIHVRLPPTASMADITIRAVVG